MFVCVCLGFLFRFGWLGFLPSVLEGRNKCGGNGKCAGVCSDFCHEPGLGTVGLQGCLSWIQGMLCSVLVLLTHQYLWHGRGKKEKGDIIAKKEALKCSLVLK